jgi:hypothetical protein
VRAWTAASERLTGRQRFELAFAHERADRIAVFDVANNPALFKLMLGKENPWYGRDCPPL